VAEETTQEVTQEAGQDPNEQPQEGTSEGQAPALDLEALQLELKEARRQTAKYRTELRALQEAEETRQRAEMSDLEKAKADLEAARAAQAKAEGEARERLINSALINAAAKANFSDPADAVKLIDAGALEVADDGAVIGADKAIEALAKEKPYLLKKASAATSPTNAARDAGTRSDDDMRKLVYEGQGNDALWDGGVRRLGG
jgi:hypothetical protein